jgi:hypothetical protein
MFVLHFHQFYQLSFERSKSLDAVKRQTSQDALLTSQVLEASIFWISKKSTEKRKAKINSAKVMTQMQNLASSNASGKDMGQNILKQG